MRYAETGAGYSNAVQWAYDEKNNLSSQTQNISGTVYTTGYTYDNDNRLTSSSQGGVTTGYTYAADGTGRLTQMLTKNGTASVVTTNIGYVDSSTTSTTAQVKTWNVDAPGTAVDKTYSYTYDNHGNILTVTGGGTAVSYVYDGLDQVVRENNQAAGKTWTYTYNVGGNITVKREYAYSTGPSSVTYSSTKYFYLKNAQGDILGLVDASGNQVVAYTYDAWGKILTQTGSLAATLGKANPFRYRGYVYDEETGLYYLQSFYYNPGMGRFINADGEVGKKGDIVGHNLFAYCINNPMNRTDASGQRSVEDGPGSAWTMVTRSGNVVSGGRTVSMPAPAAREDDTNIVREASQSVATGVLDAAAGRVINNELRVKVENLPFTNAMRVAKNTGSLARFTRWAGKTVGAASIAFFAYDVIKDFHNYNGWDAGTAVVIDAAGLAVGALAGVGITALCASFGVGAIVGGGLTMLAGAAINYGVDYAKDRWLRE